jgi:hypothetical protein
MNRKLHRALSTAAVSALTVLGVASAARADTHTGYAGCSASEFIRLYHQSSVSDSFTHKVNGVTYGTNFSNVGLTYTGVRNGNWDITSQAYITQSSATCY